MVSEFDKNLNISYVEDNLETPSQKLIFKHCICSYIVYLLIYIILRYNPFFNDFFNPILRQIYMTAFVCYIFLAPVVYFIAKPKTLHKSHNIEVCNYFLRIFKQIFNKNTVLNKDYLSILKSFIPTYNEKQAIMLIFIKLFFGCLMANFLNNDINAIKDIFENYKNIFLNTTSDSVIDYLKQIFSDNNQFFYNSTVTILFTIDVLFFVIGYLTECSFLKNKIRTVDTNILGVIFCLMCYPPFNRITTTFLGWNQSDNPAGLDYLPPYINWGIRITALFFLLIYALASVALGTKASNLTNRGTVSKFPYNIVRHPAYISKILFWILTTIPVFFAFFDSPYFNLGEYITHSLLVICSIIFWCFIYYMRAITEERHLMQDPEYQEYAKKVPWRFIPHII